MRFQTVSDLKTMAIWAPFRHSPGWRCSCKLATALRPGHGPCAVEDVSPHREPVSRRSSSQALHVCRPVSLQGLCPADLPGEPARYRTCLSGQSKSSIIWAWSRRSAVRHWPMRTSRAIGACMPSLHTRWFIRPGCCMRRTVSK